MYVCTWLNEFVVNPPLIETFKEERGRDVRGGEQRLNALLKDDNEDENKGEKSQEKMSTWRKMKDDEQRIERTRRESIKNRIE